MSSFTCNEAAFRGDAIPEFRLEPWDENFSMSYYWQILESLAASGRNLTTFSELMNPNFNPVLPFGLLRHDIDIDLEAAVELAKREAERGVQSTYFVLLDSSNYKISDQSTVSKLSEIAALGHEVGLHYAHQPPSDDRASDEQDVVLQKDKLEQALEQPVQSVSFHLAGRHPNVWIRGQLNLAGLVNAYAGVLIDPTLGAVYASDSNNNWSYGEPIERVQYANKAEAHVIQLLTHAEWWDLS